MSNLTSKQKRAYKEKLRFAELNEKIKKLRVLMNMNSGEEASNDKVLTRAFELVKVWRKENLEGPYAGGLMQGLNESKFHVMKFLNTLNLDFHSVQEIQEYFDVEIFGAPLFPSYTPPHLESNWKLVGEKEKKNLREKARRERMISKFTVMEDFLVQNKFVWKTRKHTSKSNILDVIHEYIRETMVKRLDWTDEMKKDHSQGVLKGQRKGKELAVKFFENQPDLLEHSISIGLYLEMQWNPTILQTHLVLSELPNVVLIPASSVPKVASTSGTPPLTIPLFSCLPQKLQVVLATPNFNRNASAFQNNGISQNQILKEVVTNSSVISTGNTTPHLVSKRFFRPWED